MYQNIPILEVAKNIGTFHVHLTLGNFSLTKQLRPSYYHDEQKVVVLKRHNEILCRVKEKINEKLDPSKT